MKVAESQESIKEWFDKIYEEKDFSYLRPIEAYEIFISILLPRKNQNHLDVACGLGLLMKIMGRKDVKTTGIDISEVAVSKAKELNPSSDIVLGNAENLPFEDQSFDSISCIGSIERMIDRKKALLEQHRVGKNNAKYIYMVRNSNHWLWKYFQKPLGLYNKEGHQDAKNFIEWKALFEECGFRYVGLFPDHWPFLKAMTTLFPFVKWNYGKIRRFPLPTNTAYELIFLLEKK